MKRNDAQDNRRRNMRGTHTHDSIDVTILDQMQEDELAHCLSQLEYKLRTTADMLTNRRSVEEDVAYVQREIQVRRARTRAHAEWLLRNPWVGRRDDAPAN